MKVIGVVGISGVGKSTLIRRVADQSPVAHLQASELIKAEQERLGYAASTSEELRAGPVLSNQALLISGFQNAVNSCSGETVLFDGHVLIDSGFELVEVPESVFAELKCDGIVVLTDDPDEIVRRRSADSARIRPIRLASEILDQQHKVVNRARCIARELDIPCTVIDVGEKDALRRMVAAID